MSICAFGFSDPTTVSKNERDRLQSELDRLRADVKPVLRAAEKVEEAYGNCGGVLTRDLMNAFIALADKRAIFRQQHPKGTVEQKYPHGAWRRRDGTYFRAVALDATEGPKVNARGDCWDTYVPLDQLLSEQHPKED